MAKQRTTAKSLLVTPFTRLTIFTASPKTCAWTKSDKAYASFLLPWQTMPRKITAAIWTTWFLKVNATNCTYPTQSPLWTARRFCARYRAHAERMWLFGQSERLRRLGRRFDVLYGRSRTRTDRRVFKCGLYRRPAAPDTRSEVKRFGAGSVRIIGSSEIWKKQFGLWKLDFKLLFSGILWQCK